jgi:hypothetical protein
MPISCRTALRAIAGLSAIALVLAASSSFASAHTTAALRAPHGPAASGSQDLYLGNILGGVLLYSTGKNPHQVGDIANGVPRVTGVWVDQSGVLYAFTDNAQYPYETIEEFKPGAGSPFFSLVLQRYGSLVAADSKQNVYAQGENPQGQQVIDVYPPGSQSFANEYVVPSIGKESGIEGIAFDSSGALLVGVAAFANNRQGEVGAVFRLSAGSSTFVNLNLQKAYGGLIATDGAGNLYVGGGRLISVYAAGATSPSRTLRTKEQIVTLTAASNGTLYVDTFGAEITVYAPGKKSPRNSFVPQAQVSGLALGPG